MAKKRRTFAEVQNTMTRVRGRCPRCGVEGARPGNVQIRLWEHKKGQPQKTIATKAIAFCEACSIDVWESTALTLDEAANQLPSLRGHSHDLDRSE